MQYIFLAGSFLVPVFGSSPDVDAAGFEGGAEVSTSVLGSDATTVLMTSFEACCTGLTGCDAVGGDSTWHCAELGAMVQMSAEGAGAGGALGSGGKVATGGGGHPGSNGLTVHMATLGSRAEQPSSMLLATHCASVGSTLSQPGSAALEVHTPIDGSTAAVARATVPSLAPPAG